MLFTRSKASFKSVLTKSSQEVEGGLMAKQPYNKALEYLYTYLVDFQGSKKTQQIQAGEFSMSCHYY